MHQKEIRLKIADRMEHTTAFYFEEITLLITHYNRSNSLKRLLDTLHNQAITFREIVVSDDGSDETHVNNILALKADYPIKLITTEQNRGLGHNINKGQDAVSTPFTLYIQEDFVPSPALGPVIHDGLAFLKEDPQWDIIRFHSLSWARYPYLKAYKKGFSVMKFSLLPWYTNKLKFFYYCDNPHLRRSTFSNKFGRFRENCTADQTEWSMALSFLKKKGKGLYYNSEACLFEHINDDEEPGQYRHKKNYSKLLYNSLTRSIYEYIKTLRKTLELLWYKDR